MVLLKKQQKRKNQNKIIVIKSQILKFDFLFLKNKLTLLLEYIKMIIG